MKSIFSAAIVISALTSAANASTVSVDFTDINVTTGFGAFLYTASGSATFELNDSFDPTAPFGLGNSPHGNYDGAPSISITTSRGTTYSLTDELFNNVASGPISSLGADPKVGITSVDASQSTFGPDFYVSVFGTVLVAYSDLAAIVSQPVGSTSSIAIELEFGTEFADFATGDFSSSISESGTGLATATILESAPSPVPLPASLPLLAAGLIGMGTFARRKKSA